MPSLRLVIFVYAIFLSDIALAADRDLLMAVMDNGRGEETMREQLVEHESCMGLLSSLTNLQKEDQKMQLTFADPPFGGYVIDIYCIRPDGTIIGRNGIARRHEGRAESSRRSSRAKTSRRR